MRRLGQVRGGGVHVLVDGLPGERLQEPSDQHLHVAVVALVVLVDHAAEPRVVLLVRRFPWLLLAERGVRRGHLREPLQDEAELDRHRLLAPERAVIVENGNTFFGRHLPGRRLGEGNDRISRRRIVPRREAHQSRAPLVASAIFSSAWSIVKLAAFWRGGNAENVARNSPTIACAARIM